MPKVSEDYLKDKKNMIIDAAFKVCNSKPVYDVTMKDIIRERNISQGGMYRFFKDIDEVFVEMLNKCNNNLDYENKANQIFIDNEDPDIKIVQLCKYIGSIIDDMIAKYGKVAFELNMIYVNDKVRLQKVQNKLQENVSANVLVIKLFEYINENICSGYFMPKIEKEKIFALFIASIDGITRDITINNSYQIDTINLPKHQITAESLMETLAQALILMLNKK